MIEKREGNDNKEIANIFKFWSYSHEENTNWVVQLITNGLKRAENLQVPSWFEVLKYYFFELDDEFNQQRVGTIIERVHKCFVKFSNYPKYTKALVTGLFELHDEYPMVKRCILSEEENCAEYDKWSGNNNFPRRFL